MHESTENMQPYEINRAGSENSFNRRSFFDDDTNFQDFDGEQDQFHSASGGGGYGGGGGGGGYGGSKGGGGYSKGGGSSYKKVSSCSRQVVQTNTESRSKMKQQHKPQQQSYGGGGGSSYGGGGGGGGYGGGGGGYEQQPAVSMNDGLVIMSDCRSCSFLQPEPYEFAYGSDDGYGVTQERQESQDASGNVRGSYSFKDDKGLMRRVTICSDRRLVPESSFVLIIISCSSG